MAISRNRLKTTSSRHEIILSKKDTIFSTPSYFTRSMTLKPNPREDEADPILPGTECRQSGGLTEVLDELGRLIKQKLSAVAIAWSVGETKATLA
jgi:hypothetical protein